MIKMSRWVIGLSAPQRLVNLSLVEFSVIRLIFLAFLPMCIDRLRSVVDVIYGGVVAF